MSLPDEPRTVKPRKPVQHPDLPIIAVDREGRSLFCESTGEVYGWGDAANLFRIHPPSIVIAPGAAHLLADLEQHYADDPLWQYRVTPVKRERFSSDPTRKRRHTVDTLVNYFGWKGASYTTGTGKPAHRKGHWHYPVDPTLFATIPLRELIGGLAPADFLAWGRDLREWCAENDLHPSPTAGGLGGQLLRDPRWYPEPRRKVPRATNGRARPVLPGNYYRLLWPEHSPVDATYIDMSSSHHHMAAQVQFPSSNGLYARGNFRTTETSETPVSRNTLWAQAGTPRYNLAIQAYGLFRLQLNVPALKPSQFPPPYMEDAGRKLVYVYSNEIPMILSLGGEIEGIFAAWTSYTLDTGLNGFARWALSEIAAMTPERKRWCKVALLATYGNLAAKVRTQEFAYRTAQGGVSKQYPAGPHFLDVRAHVGETELEIPTVNVVHRGMIEAEQRRAVLDLARDLTGQGHTVVSIYADAIMVLAGPALPLLPPPWRVDAHLTRLKFATPTAFTSAERTKLPGIAREDIDRWRRIAEIRPRHKSKVLDSRV